MKTYNFENKKFTWGRCQYNILEKFAEESKMQGIIIKFKNCKFNHISFRLIKGAMIKLYFDDCDFHDTAIKFYFDSEHVVVFKNCKFKSVTNDFKRRSYNTFPLRITGNVGPKSILRFENCTGLTKDYFTANAFRESEKGEIDLGVTNPKCTLSYMGLYQLFKDRILSKAKEEVGYKKVYVFKSSPIRNSKGKFTVQELIGTAIATLVIPKGVVRYGDRNGKCRCQYAIVRDITPIPSSMSDTTLDAKRVYRSIFEYRVKYKVGEIIRPDAFDLMPGECSNGIHYFYDINDAMKYKS